MTRQQTGPNGLETAQRWRGMRGLLELGARDLRIWTLAKTQRDALQPRFQQEVVWRTPPMNAQTCNK